MRQWVNSSTPSAAYMRQWTGPALVQVMACRLFGAKPLPEPILAYCQLDSWEQISVKFESEFYNFHSRKCIWKYRLPECRPLYPGGDELTLWGIGETADFLVPCVCNTDAFEMKLWTEWNFNAILHCITITALTSRRWIFMAFFHKLIMVRLFDEVICQSSPPHLISI